MAQVDYFLKIEGIEGESQDAKHKNEIDVLSFSWAETQQGTGGFGGGGGAGKVLMQDFHFTAKASKASPLLFLACANGEHIKSALLTTRKAGKDQQEYYTIKLTDILVSAYQTAGSSQGDALPIDQVSLNFAKYEMEYKEQKPDGTLGGSVKKGWDVKANQKI